VLGACEHIAQIYAELKRRHKAMRARAMLREQLQRYSSGLACAGQTISSSPVHASF
jgi:hypothetical protein